MTVIRPLRTLVLTALAAACLAACGGGGGGSASSIPGGGSGGNGSAPAPGTVSPPGSRSPGGSAGGGSICTSSTASQCFSTWTVTSNPSGLTVQLNGQTVGTTPTTVTPQPSGQGQTIAIVSGSQTYSVAVQQTSDGPHSIFYNAQADSTGTVATSTLQSLRTAAASRSAIATVPLAARRFDGAARAKSGLVAGQAWVRYDASALGGRDEAAIEHGAGATLRATVPGLRATWREVAFDPSIPFATFAARLRASDAAVAEVTPVHLRHALGAGRGPATVNDPLAETSDQWYLFADGFPRAWSYTQGGSATIAVLDTGCDDRITDLRSVITREGLFVGGSKTIGAAGSHTSDDADGHGTNVAGIADALANNGVGFAGGAYGAHLMCYRIFDAAGNANPADEANAIADAVANGADVINLSLGAESAAPSAGDPLGGVDSGEQAAIQNAIAKGVTIVAAAGNCRDGATNGDPSCGGVNNVGTINYPAGYDGVIAVGASALKDNGTAQYASATEYVAPYSESGPGLGLVAPGGDAPDGNTADLLHWIENYSSSTAGKCRTPSPPDKCVELFNGTSQATPQVTAAVALIDAAAGHLHYTPSQIAYLLESTADNIGDPNQGRGRLNVGRALAALSGDTEPFSGPTAVRTGTSQLIAFAYAAGGTNRPQILDATYPVGVPIDPLSGQFRIADVPVSAGSYRVAVWYDANGDGYIDAGDQIGVASTSCGTQAPCAIGTITMQSVGAGYVLP